MHKLTKSIILIITLTISLTGICQDWELQKNENGIKVYYKKYSEHKHEIKVTTTINASRNKLQYIISDYENMTHWVCRCEKAEFVTGTDNKKYLRTVTTMPWPFDNRDLISKRLPVIENSDYIILRTKSTPKIYPSQDDCVRQKVSDTSWKLKEIAKNKTHIEYHLEIELEESLPDCITKMVTCNGPFDTFVNLKEYVKNH